MNILNFNATARTRTRTFIVGSYVYSHLSTAAPHWPLPAPASSLPVLDASEVSAEVVSGCAPRAVGSYDFHAAARYLLNYKTNVRRCRVHVIVPHHICRRTIAGKVSGSSELAVPYSCSRQSLGARRCGFRAQDDHLLRQSSRQNNHGWNTMLRCASSIHRRLQSRSCIAADASAVH